MDPKAKKVRQRRWSVSVEKSFAIMEEVDCLLAVRFIAVRYAYWLSNVVLIEKASGKWRMCVNFMDLNKACPKDSFPFPQIDLIVDSTAGHRMLGFMDAYLGYN